MSIQNPQWDDWDESEDNEDFTVPGIDDCDFLYSLTSRNGNDAVYIRIHQFGPQDFRAAITVDSETGHFVEDLPANEGPHGIPELAFRANVEAARKWFRDNGLAYVYCDDSRRIVRARHTGKN